MRGMGLQLGFSGAAPASSAGFCENAHRCNGGFGGFSSLCSDRVAFFPRARNQPRRRGGEIRARLHFGLWNPSYLGPPPLFSWASTPLKRRRISRFDRACPDLSSFNFAECPTLSSASLQNDYLLTLGIRKNHEALTCMATLGFEISPATVVVLSTVLGFAALRIYVYFRMEYIIAAMLGRHVPRGGAQVVELNTRGGKNLYYYPADIAQVVAVGSTSNVQLLESQASRAGVPIQVKTKGPAALGVPSSSIDAVVSVFCLRDFRDKEVLDILREAVRVLKPGKPLIFVETVRAKNDLVGTLLNLMGTKRAENLLPYLQEVDLEEVVCEEVLSSVDPHLVGVAKKKLSVVIEPKKEVRKGFKSSKARQG